MRAESPLTQFGRAMKVLGVELILANSPQAKGRVERCNGTLQDRLVKEMRLAGVSDIAAANAFLAKTFLPAFNRQFAVAAREPADLHVPLSTALAAGKGVRLDEVLCWEEQRVVRNDWCVRWRNRVFQLDRRHEALGLAGRKVTVREKLDGSVQLLSNGHKLHWKELPERPGTGEGGEEAGPRTTSGTCRRRTTRGSAASRQGPRRLRLLGPCRDASGRAGVTLLLWTEG